MKKLLLLTIVGFSLQCVIWDEKTTDSQKFEDVLIAIEKNDVEFLKEHMKEFLQSETWSCHSYKEGRLFEKAVRENKLEIVKIFIEAGIGSDIDTYSQRAPLYSALENENEEMLDLLLNNGANPSARCWFSDYDEPSAFDLAIKKNRLDLIKNFIEAQKKYKFPWPQSDMLSEALCHEKENIALFLIESDEEGNLIDRVGGGKYTPIQEAFSMKLIKAAEALLNTGVNIDYQGNCQKETNLHLVCEDNWVDGVEKLIEYGADLLLKNRYEKLPEDLTENEEIKLSLKTARTLQENIAELSKKSETIFSLISSWPLLSFTMHQMQSKDDFSLFYRCMNDDEKQVNNIARLLNKETLKNQDDFKNSLLDKAALRLKAHFYNNCIVEENDYKEKFGNEEFKKMFVTASRMKKFNEKN